MEEKQLKAVTLNEFKAKLEIVKLEDMTEQDLLGYITYGTQEQLNNTGVQKKLIKYGYLEYLIHIVDKLEVTEEILGEMTSSELFKTKGYMIKQGTIEHIEIAKHKWLPEDYIWDSIRGAGREQARQVHNQISPCKAEIQNKIKDAKRKANHGDSRAKRWRIICSMFSGCVRGDWWILEEYEIRE